MQLKIRNLSKRYENGVQALAEVSLDIPPGMFGLLGPNGAGKSTLMRILATLQDADTGSVQLGDIDVLAERDRVRACLGYLPQDFGLYPRVSALDLLDHLALLKGIQGARQRRTIVHDLLQRTNLYEARRRNLGSFSGGMRQRFGIAQALLGNPRLIIVDEPTAGLDPEERARFHGLLADIGESVVVLLSTHIVGDVSDLCQRMAILNRGQVVLQGSPLELIAEHLEQRVWRKPIDRNDAAAKDAAFPVIGTRRLAGQLLLHVYGEERPGAGFEPATPDLEDLYFYALRSRAAASPRVAEPPASIAPRATAQLATE